MWIWNNFSLYFSHLSLGKYISVNARGDVQARSDAVGPQEQIEVVIEDGKVALQGHNGYFITVNDDGEIKALSRTAKTKEIVTLRTNASRRWVVV